MKKVVLDIDGVIADTRDVVKRYVCVRFGLDPEILTGGDEYNNIYKLEDQVLHNEVNDYVMELFQKEPEVYRQAKTIKGAWYGTRILKPEAYITRRTAENGIDIATTEWMKKVDMYPAPVYFIPKGTCKSEKAKELGADFIVEDSPFEIQSCRDNDLPVIVFKYPYNVSQCGNDGQVSNWKELVKLWESLT